MSTRNCSIKTLRHNIIIRITVLTTTCLKTIVVILTRDKEESTNREIIILIAIKITSTIRELIITKRPHIPIIAIS